MKVLVPGFIAIFAGAAVGAYAALPPNAPGLSADVELVGTDFKAYSIAVPRREGEKTDGYVVVDVRGTHDDSLTDSAATAYVTAALGLLASTHQVQDLDPDVLVHRDRLAQRITAALATMGQDKAIWKIEVGNMGFMARQDGG